MASATETKKLRLNRLLSHFARDEAGVHHIPAYRQWVVEEGGDPGSKTRQEIAVFSSFASLTK